MLAELVRTAAKGGLAGALGSVVQAAVGKSEDIALLPSYEDSHIAPRLMRRLAEKRGGSLTTAESWVLGTLFHVGYGASWGKLYALARERRPVHPLVGGAVLGSLIYLITFPRWGGAVITGTERRPELRTARMSLVATSVALSYGISTAYLYEMLRDAEGEDG